MDRAHHSQREFKGCDYAGHTLLHILPISILSMLESFNTLHGANEGSPVREILNSGKFPLIKDTHLIVNLIGPNTVGLMQDICPG